MRAGRIYNVLVRLASRLEMLILTLDNRLAHCIILLFRKYHGNTADGILVQNANGELDVHRHFLKHELS